jgi:hypothetical protein
MPSHPSAPHGDRSLPFDAREGPPGRLGVAVQDVEIGRSIDACHVARKAITPVQLDALDDAGSGVPIECTGLVSGHGSLSTDGLASMSARPAPTARPTASGCDRWSRAGECAASRPEFSGHGCARVRRSV